MNIMSRNNVNSNRLDDIISVIASSDNKRFIIRLGSFENIGQFNEFAELCKENIPNANITISTEHTDEVEGVYATIEK